MAKIVRKMYAFQFLFSKVDFQVMNYHPIRSIVLKNVLPSHEMVTHKMRTNF
jgi:hypothetical protein